MIIGPSTITICFPTLSETIGLYLSDYNTISVRYSYHLHLILLEFSPFCARPQ